MKFEYSKFIGRDEKCHVEIDRVPLVVPLESAQFNSPSSLARWLRRKKKGDGQGG